MRVLAFGSYRPDLHPRVAVLLDGLRAAGHDVTEVNEPLPLDTAARVGLLQRPWRLPLLAAALARTWVRLAVRGRRAARTVRPDAVLVGYLGHFDVHLARVLFPRATLVLDQLVFAADTARDRGATGAAVLAALDRLDRAATAAADVVVVDTAESATLVRSQDAAKVVEVPVGATAPWFDAARDARAGAGRPGELSVVFFGLFTPLQGTTTIAAALAELAPEVAVRLTLVGGGQDEAEVRRLVGEDPRVTWLPWVAPEELPALVAGHDVCLGVFGTTAKAARVVPTKVYQGAAAGCAVVTSRTGPQVRALGDAAVYVPAGDARALAAALTRLAGDRALVDHHRAQAARVADERFRPSAVIAPLTERIAMPASTDPAPPLSPSATMRWPLVRQELARTAPRTVLELGCGQGAAGARLAGAYEYTGVEPDKESYRLAAERLAGRGRVLHGDAGALDPDERFDAACAFEVLEHIDDDRGALASWVARVRPGGAVVLSVPAWQHRFGAGDRRVGHFRRYDPDALRTLLLDVGLQDVRVRLYGWPLGYLLEAVRNRSAGAAEQGESMSDRTALSGRWRQPGRRLGGVLRVAVAPFAAVSRAVPGRGVGIVASGRVPVA